MGYGIMAYAVQLAKIERVLGSGDAAFLARMDQNFREEFASDRADRDDDDEDELTLEQAFHEMIEGKPLQPEYVEYGYAFKWLCEQFGRSLPNSEFVPIHFPWVDEMDAGLARAGVPAEILSLTRLMYRGVPVAIPDPSDFPFIGFLKADEIPPALRALEGADLSGLDHSMRDSVAQLRGWLETCSASACDLVCFTH